jgi:sec-independent protein translocase protein TatA
MSTKFVSLIIILALAFLLFGHHRLRNIGTDLAEAIKNFRKGLKDSEQQNRDDNN